MSKSHKLICKVADDVIKYFKNYNNSTHGCSKTLDLVEDKSISITVSVHRSKDDSPIVKLIKAEKSIKELEKQLEDACRALGE